MREEERVGIGDRDMGRNNVRQRVKYWRYRVKSYREIQVTEGDRGSGNETERRKGDTGVKVSATEKI